MNHMNAAFRGGRRDCLTLERSDGWPESLGRLLLAVAMVALVLVAVLYHPTPERGQIDLKAYIVRLSLLGVGWGILLLTWRRGVTIDRVAGTLTRWWGLRLGLATLVLRRTETRTLADFRGIRVLRAGPTDHYKRWRHGMYRVQLEKSESVGGQWGLRERLIVDDEFKTPDRAAATGRAVACLLGLEMIDRTSA